MLCNLKRFEGTIPNETEDERLKAKEQKHPVDEMIFDKSPRTAKQREHNSNWMEEGGDKTLQSRNSHFSTTIHPVGERHELEVSRRQILLTQWTNAISISIQDYRYSLFSVDFMTWALGEPSWADWDDTIQKFVRL